MAGFSAGFDTEHVLRVRRILLIGSHQAGKSSSGNTILGKQVFPAEEVTSESSACRGEVFGWMVTVVDTPGLGRGLDGETDVSHLQESVNPWHLSSGVLLCSPGPHVILLVVSVSQTFTENHKKTLESHLEGLGRGIWRYTIVLFTGVDALGEDGCLESHIIEGGEPLQNLVERCGNRYQGVDNTQPSKRTQVQELLLKVEEVVDQNHGWFLEVDSSCRLLSHYKTTNNQMWNVAVQAERSVMASWNLEEIPMYISTPRELRMILLGWQGAGKSMAGNTILGFQGFDVGKQTEVSLRKQSRVSGRQVTVVDTPGWHWWSVKQTPQQVKREIRRASKLLHPGPHTLLLVLPAVSSLTSRKRHVLEDHMERIFGEQWAQYTLVLFTCGDWLRGLGYSIEEHIQRSGKELLGLLETCGNYYHILNSKDHEGHRQIPELLDKVEEIIANNTTDPYLYTDVDEDSMGMTESPGCATCNLQ